MMYSHERYRCYPSVVCVRTETTITIFPRDLSRRFRENKKYEIAIRGMNDDESDYHDPIVYSYSGTVQDGCLILTCTLETEQEYVIWIRENEGKIIKLPIYSVEKDLYELRPLKGNLHTHSYYSDAEDGIPMIPANYREQGFDFFALTDHNRMFPSELAAELYKDIPLDITVMHGEELHTPGSQLHIVHVGGSESVCNQYIHHDEEFQSAVEEIEKEMSTVPEQYRHRMAQAKWACDEIHKTGGIAIYAHPFWRSRNYNISKNFSDLLFDAKLFDALELMGGVHTQDNSKQLALWQEQLMKGNMIPVVGSDDSHMHDYSKDHFGFGHRFTYVFAKSNSTKDILDAIRNGYSVSGEIPMSNEEEVHFYSTNLRFVLFAHFLYNNYFVETKRLSFGEGILMRRYAEGEPVGEILSSLANTVENFYKKFYGLTSAPTLPRERQDFLDRCLDMQQNIGPKTRGTILYKHGSNERHE